MSHPAHPVPRPVGPFLPPPSMVNYATAEVPVRWGPRGPATLLQGLQEQPTGRVLS